MWEVSPLGSSPPVPPVQVLLLHMDGTNGSTTFTDATGRHVLIPHGAAQISTTKSKFGGASGNFGAGGTNGNFLSSDGNGDFVFGTGDFTIDCWINGTNSGAFWELICDFEASGPQLYVNQSNQISYGLFEGAAVISGAATWDDGNWHHYAVTRASGNTRLFFDGTQVGSTYVAFDNLSIDATAGLSGPWIGSFSNGNANAEYIDEFRIIKGGAAWTNNFTPPTSPYLP